MDLKGNFGFTFKKEEELEPAGFYSDDESGKDFEDDFDSMEQREQEKTENMLLETEFKLFQESYDYLRLIQEKLAKDAIESTEEEKFRYYSIGYAANVDQVDELEISRWQSRFPYFQVVGWGEEPREDEKIPFSKDSARDAVDSEDVTIDGLDFAIVGCKVVLHERSSVAENVDGVDEEILNYDGIVEEVFAIHYDYEIVENSKEIIIVETEPS
jgi:hypothetical protein